MFSSVNECAAALRASSDAGERRRLEVEVTRAARSLLLRRIRSVCARHGASADAEDAVQVLTANLVPGIIAGTPPPPLGEEERYLVASARKRAYDILKGKGLFRHRRFDPFAPDGEPTGNPYADLEHNAEFRQMAELVVEALSDLRESYREVIEAHWHEQLPLTAIAQRWVDEGRATTLAKARQNVQAAHSRGLKALRAMVVERWEAREA